MDLRKKICLNHCPYYKPSKDENMACLGFSVISRLITDNTKISFESVPDKPDESIARILTLDMCVSCPFFENACDFIAGDNDALPCGGFILLADLIKKEIFTINDVITESRFSPTPETTIGRAE